MQPFLDNPPVRPSIFDRIRRRPSVQNAARDIEALLAHASSVGDVSAKEIDDTLATYRGGRALISALEDLYRAYLRHVLHDRHLSADESADLLRLAELLGLPEHTVTTIRDEAVHEVYGQALTDAVKDGRLDDDERSMLTNLQTNLGISAGAAERALHHAGSARLQKAYEQAIEDQRLSPEEERDLEEMARSLGVTVSLSYESRAALERARLHWQIENGPLPSIDPGISLPRTEICHFRTPVDWYEHRRVTKAVRYSGPTARVRLAKGVYWRMGQVGVQRLSEDVLTKIDSGIIYLTSKRLLFQGGRGNKTVRLGSIFDFTPYTNGVDIQKDAGKSPFLEFDNQVDVFALILNRLLDER